MINISKLDYEVLGSILENVTKEELKILSPTEAFDKYLNWHGIISYTDQLINALDNIRGAAHTTERLMAEAILKAVKIREEDYKPGHFYGITLEDACNRAVGEGLGRLIYLALKGQRNETIEWAKLTLNPPIVMEIDDVDSDL